jgi:hypothetical protein
MPSDTQRDHFEISKWVNDQFETGQPQELNHPPHDPDDLPHWTSDPESGITGVVYLGEREVYYYAPDIKPKTGWWKMGPLPAALN